MRPLIAVTGVPIKPGGVAGWKHGALAVAETYVQSVARAGGDPVIILPESLDAPGAAGRLARFDGLLMVGGGDIDPARYGATEVHPAVAYVNPVRDNFEIPLVMGAIAAGLPTLAICRGVQVLNVALGGTLHQHVGDLGSPIVHRHANGEDGVLHPVRVDPASRLGKAMGTDRADGLSHHHQALDRVAPGLVPVAWADDGLVEAAEHEERWVVGVQWHAEATAATDPVQQNIFDAFVEQAGAGR